jgi:hypothetical protein
MMDLVQIFQRLPARADASRPGEKRATFSPTLGKICIGLLAALLVTDGFAQTNDHAWRFEVGALAGWTKPKYRTRNGTDQTKGSEVFSRDLQTEHEELRPGLYAYATRGRHRFGVSGWILGTEGDGRVEKEFFFDQQLVRVGRPFEAESEFEHAQVDWLYQMKSTAGVQVSAGLAIEYTSFEADMDFGESDLSAVFPSPQFRLGWAFAEKWELEALLGGFYVPFAYGDKDVTEHYELQAAVRRTWGDFVAEAGWNMYHLHIEKDAGDIGEEVVHMRLRGIYVSAGVRF